MDTGLSSKTYIISTFADANYLETWLIFGYQKSTLTYNLCLVYGLHRPTQSSLSGFQCQGY